MFLSLCANHEKQQQTAMVPHQEWVCLPTGCRGTVPTLAWIPLGTAGAAAVASSPVAGSCPHHLLQGNLPHYNPCNRTTQFSAVRRTTLRRGTSLIIIETLSLVQYTVQTQQFQLDSIHFWSGLTQVDSNSL